MQYSKKKLQDCTVFLYTHLPQQKNYMTTRFFCTLINRKRQFLDVTIFFVAHIYRKKNCTIYRQKKLHDVMIFFLETFTLKVKKN